MSARILSWVDEIAYPYPEWILSPADFRELARLFYAERGLPWDDSPGVRYCGSRLRDPEPGGPLLIGNVLAAAVRAIPVTVPEHATCPHERERCDVRPDVPVVRVAPRVDRGPGVEMVGHREPQAGVHRPRRMVGAVGGRAMSGPISTTVFICGTDYTPGERSSCPDPVHDYPEPAGYGQAFDVAERRLRNGWHNVRCPSGCGIYGWRPGRKSTREDVHVPYQEKP